MNPHRRALVLGGARSGKSRTAQDLAQSVSARRIYIATAAAHDDEMRERIDHHRAERDGTWLVVDAPLDLVEALRTHMGADHVVLVDCLTVWLSNVLLAERDIEQETERLVQAVADAAGPLILVSNEVGQGIVPATSLGRVFRDAQGRLNQRIAAACDVVVFVAAGCPVILKPAPPLNLTLA
jgi:adenosylcobinamide kinase / adenosylcobinamide-phosphate guanylyltransferase